MLDHDLIERLRARYTPEPVPPCRVCDGPLSIQRVGGGEPTVWACSPNENDPDEPGHLRYKAGRSGADQHYSQSRFEQRRTGDPDVLTLLSQIVVS